MGSEYDRKFEEMKKYIPFLESMINRLESNTSSSNPRQAQLDKIRSLRDLLLDKKKRMKMDNLLKCEQVLVNLYAKVEQKDTLPIVKVESVASKDNQDLEAVRNKLKSVVKMQTVNDTLPEIARASEREQNCEPGSKEPALFQRRPNISLSPTRSMSKSSYETNISPTKSQSKRNYTRVLVSPEPRTACWSASEDVTSEKPLFSRRSARRSPRRNSPSYHKKERKKAKSKEQKLRKDLNITLKVPEESLNSLNTKDIVSRIMNCSDGDVDINTLSEIRSQILGELKKTGTNDDISEIILKSYNKKTKSIRKKKHEVEEGEISDSESEAIENIYGSLVVMDKDQKSGHVKTSSDKSMQQRKIQICLVINSDKEGECNIKTANDLSESGMFDSKSQDIICIDSDASPSPSKNKNNTEIRKNKNQENDALSFDKAMEDCEDKLITLEKKMSTNSTSLENINGSTESAEIEVVTLKPTDTALNLPSKSQDSPNKKPTSPTKNIYSPSQSIQNLTPEKDKLLQTDDNLSESTKNVANFYKSQPENEDETQSDISEKTKQIPKEAAANDKPTPMNQLFSESKIRDSSEIPLLSEPVLPPKAEKSVLSEIDILQALKNEILSGTSVAIAATEADTPALHQPKITKVAPGTEAGTSTLLAKVTKPSSSNNMPKKRISIENYKKKSETVAKSLFVKKQMNAAREEIRKQSLKLTDKECERFNFFSQFDLQDDTDDISDEGDDLLDDDKDPSVDDIYGDLAPKSPDQDNFSDDSVYPVLIPIEPVKTSVTATSVTDVDMRNTPPQPVPPPSKCINVTLTQKTETTKNSPLIDSNKNMSDVRKPVDPRLRRDASQSAIKNSPNYGVMSLEGTPRPTQFPAISPLLNMTPVYTPSYTPSMTPIRTPNARTFEMTPSHQSFENEEPHRKHVYAPSFSTSDNRDREFSGSKEGPIWEPNDERRSRTDVRNPRWEHSINASAQRDLQSNYKPRNDKFHNDRRDQSGFSSQDHPTTPGSSFGWGDCPSTPSHSFGRSECPSTPSHPFGRSECPSTPSHPFGRSEGPSTPSHPFGRSECPPTPNHPFGRTECPPTPSHPFGRSDIKDPRLSRTLSDYEPSNQHHDKDSRYQIHPDYEPRNHEEKDRGYGRSYNRSNSYKSNRNYAESDSSRIYDRDRHSYEHGSRYYKNNNDNLPRRFESERSIGRTDKINLEQSGRGIDNSRRELSLSRSLSRDDNSRLFTRSRDIRDSRYSKHYEEAGSWRNQREKSIGRDLPKESPRVSARATSVGRSDIDNSVSVKPKSGGPFNINTSVNATFQNIFESGKGIQVFDYTFDARRQRASSVGRTLVRDNSVGRLHSHKVKLHEAKSVESPCFQRRNNFQRASSVGRTLVSDKAERSFQEIKADFEAYRSESSKNNSKFAIANIKYKKQDIFEPVSTSKNVNSEESQNSKQCPKQQYSPRRNNRDPRMRKGQKNPRNRYDRDNINSGNRRHSGIVYSNDNIAKGTIMGTGFGVRNYKIPKIKRSEPERPHTPIEEVIKMSEKTPSLKADAALEPDKKYEEEILKNDVSEKIKTLKTQSARRFSVENANESNNYDNDCSVKIKVIKQKNSKIAVVSDDSENSDSEIKVTKLKNVNKAILSDDDSDEFNMKNKHKVSNKNKKVVVSSDDDSDKRVTRSSKKMPLQEPVKRTKRTKKAIFDVTENKTESKTSFKYKHNKHSKKPVITKPVINEVFTQTKPSDSSEMSSKLILNKDEIRMTQNNSEAKPEKEPGLKKSPEEDSLDSSFGIDDIEIFSDNIVSDTVMGNINDLIADLDQDIGAAKSTANLNDSFTTNMDKITGDIENHEENTLGDISELIEKDLNESNELTQAHDNAINKKNELVTDNQNAVITTVSDLKPDKKEIPQNNVQLITKKSVSAIVINEAQDPKAISGEAMNDEIVSTSNINPTNVTDTGFDSNVEPFNNIEQFVPDSTLVPSNDIDMPKKLNESLPDSTIEIHSEVSSDVTSTLIDGDKSLKDSVMPSSSQKEGSTFESLGSLLFMLQDKSKIKELLSMLGDQSESEKIKKKLEKLSEIVSDDEDANDNQCKDSGKSQSTITSSKSPTIPPNSEAKSVVKDADKSEEDAHRNEELPSVEHVVGNQANDNQNDEDCNEQLNQGIDTPIPKTPKKGKMTRKTRGKGKRTKAIQKRINQSNVKLQAASLKPKKSTELQKLQNDIKEMFMCDDVLNATGIRMCRLSKMVDKKAVTAPKDNEPVVLLEKFKSVAVEGKKIRKKPGPKPKPKVVIDSAASDKEKLQTKSEDKPVKSKIYKPGPKSKTKQRKKVRSTDPYEFDTDSFADTNTTKDSETTAQSSDSDSESLASSGSFGSSENLADIKKKPKKKRGSWQTGVIKPRHKKKKETNPTNSSLASISPIPSLKPVTIPDMNCYTDKLYCFKHGVFSYDCRLCHYSGTEIVNHYKKHHAHTEVPLSRMDPKTAKRAIQQVCSEDVNFKAISKIPTDKYTCRFCYKEFGKKRGRGISVALESFFWHVVSMHTGEYKHLCYECVNVTRCPFNQDIPPPPKDIKGQLIGYICGKCNFTQISLENLKIHVIYRHNDDQTEVYSINLGVMSKKAMKAMQRKSITEEQIPRTLRSSRSNQSAVEASDERSEITSSDRLSDVGSRIPKTELESNTDKVHKRRTSGVMKSKLLFETDNQELDKESIKMEATVHGDGYPTESALDGTYNDTAPLDQRYDEGLDVDRSDETDKESSLIDHSYNKAAESESAPSTDKIIDITKTKRIVPKPRETTDVFEQPHFKLSYKETGAKEYICCVNGSYHYKTTLLISLKQHVRTKHLEKWDGYCCVCKVIVTLQGVQSSFIDCLLHFLHKHMDDFPTIEQVIDSTSEDSRSSLRSSIDVSNIERTESPITYIAVRPLSELISKDADKDPPMCDDNEPAFTEEVPKASPVYPTTSVNAAADQPKQFQYEEIQAKVMSKKHRIVLDAMMPREVLVRVFKCAGRFCSFTSDSLDEALVHASAHKQMGGEGALDCAYCNFDASGNAIDMVMHVFKEHGRCQFACIMCFYRAADVQLVSAHFEKAHGTSGKAARVLRSTYIVQSSAAVPSNMMPRETAVPYYICNHGGGSCKFRTYTPGKFNDHMIQKHDSEDKHPCNLCKFTTPTPTELIMHMKSHDLKLYQCTWCVHGANNETEMLSHAASVHPTEKPQAYLRIITNKDGPKGPRVLPLIHLNQFKVPTEDVTPSNVKGDPTKEAERSIELEKLIKHTTVLRDSQPTCDVPIPETQDETEAQAELTEETFDLPDAQTDEAREMSLLASPKQKVQKENISDVIKKEPTETQYINQKIENIVYCLDSDEEAVGQEKATAESDNQTVIDLSDDEPVNKCESPTLKQLVSQLDKVKKPTKPEKPKFKKLSLDALFKCPNCEQNFKNVGGFKRHTNTCCIELSTFQCPHAPCPIVLSNVTQLINHYNKDHNVLTISKQYYCGICESRWSTLNATKKHLRDLHSVVKVVITSKYQEDGTCSFTVDKEKRTAEPTREMSKRKPSVETPKKFGIDDIDKLPINPIMDSLVYCGVCEFSTKVRLNMVRHLQLHAERQPAPQTAPVNPVPHLETNEKHFDRMVNLASSSAAVSSVASVAAEVVARYPRHVPDRQRLTCGAKGCSYISIDEAMLRIHWETLHPGVADYHCVHCPPNQYLDTTKILTASRILAHLKMHDANLYACSSCPYYHYKKQIVEKHIADLHKEKGGQVQIVREEGMNCGAPPSAVGTMDLKPWQCGLCQFKSMLRPAVVEHCSSQHHTKMPYKCAYCPFRTSAVENVTKHQTNSHPNKAADVFYFYYREGTVPDEADGTPRWQRQRQKSGIEDTGVKTEPEPDSTPIQPLSKTSPIDLSLVKKEILDVNQKMSVEELCKRYGKFCDPNGISYKCSLCMTVTEYTREAMHSHLYEELKYRRWGCALCTYKAYHRAGLTDHMTSEHRGNFIEPSELSPDENIETWVSKLLDHQSAIIEKNKSNAMQKMAVEKPVAGPSKVTPEPPKHVQVSSDIELEQAFGSLGSPKDNSYCCPKCKTTIREEDQMRNHLESELTKIRWCCTKCTDKFATFHEAQFHCKIHPGLLTRPKEAIRDSSLRNAWVTAVINAQKTCMKPHDTAQGFREDLADNSDNSLLVVRYEEAAPTEEQLRDIAREQQLKETRKRSAFFDSDSEDDDSLVIHEPEAKKSNNRQCPYCEFVSSSTKQYKLIMKEHILRHYNLKLMTCSYCQFNGNRRQMYIHMNEFHQGLKQDYKHTEIPNCLPNEYNLKQYAKKPDKKDKITEDVTSLKVCLHCEGLVSSDELITHLHGNKPTEFGDKGEVVVKCCICLTLRKNLASMQDHYQQAHVDIRNLNYAFYKLHVDTREVQSCGICNRRFTFMRDLKTHHMSMHAAFALSYKTVPYRPDEDDHEIRGKRRLSEPSVSNPTKRIAKKSTAKLPFNNIIAKKSTTKLPFAVDPDSDDEFSYYGTKPVSFNEYENVKTMMPMYNTMVEIDVKQLSGILKIDPKVIVPDCKK